MDLPCCESISSTQQNDFVVNSSTVFSLDFLQLIGNAAILNSTAASRKSFRAMNILRQNKPKWSVLPIHLQIAS